MWSPCTMFRLLIVRAVGELVVRKLHWKMQSYIICTGELTLYSRSVTWMWHQAEYAASHARLLLLLWIIVMVMTATMSITIKICRALYSSRIVLSALWRRRFGLVTGKQITFRLLVMMMSWWPLLNLLNVWITACRPILVKSWTEKFCCGK